MEGTIKERLLKRFTDARDQLGHDWRRRLAESNPAYDSIEGERIMNSVSGAVTEKRRCGVDRIESVVVAMEEILNKQLAEA